MNRIAIRRLAVCAVSMSFLLMCGVMAGCSVSGKSAPSDGETLTVTDFAGRNVVFGQPPQRIVALGNGEVELIYALGGEVVGRPEVDRELVIEAAKDVPTVGSTHTVDMEKIAALKPDVVLGHDPINANDVPLLQRLGVQTVLTHANSIDDIRRQIALFGELLDKREKAAELTAKLDAELGQIREKPEDEKRVLIVYGAPGTFMAALPNSLAGDLLSAAGGRNVAADFPSLSGFPQYAQLNTERVVEARPDLILIMTHGDAEAVRQGFVREMESNTAWRSVTAVQQDGIHVLPPDLFGTNPGTRAAEAAQWLAELLDE